jgi:alpha-1,3/alpha-1,6-mannosyltransferase
MQGIGLAIQALQHLVEHHNCIASCRLVLAGGYDARLPENVEHLEELRELAESMGVSHLVLFMPSFTDQQRTLLLAACIAVIYTPAEEHFGIVPLEAMAAGRPVVACSSGGPLETVVQGQTGLLCEPTPPAFATAMARLLEPGTAQEMGQQARKHVLASFSRQAFGDKLDRIALDLASRSQPKFFNWRFLFFIFLFPVVAFYCYVYLL